MYNVFKRPMFKLGGQADQGTGIMSTVEPKQTMIQNPYTGYAIGGRIMAQGGYDPRGTYFGYGPDPRGTYFGPGSTKISPVGSVNPINTISDIEALTGTGTGQSQSAFEKGQAARREAMNRAVKYGKYIPAAASTASQFGAGFLGPTVTGGLATLGTIAAPIAAVGALAYSGRARNQSELDYIKNTIPPSEASGEGDYDAYMAGKTAAYKEGVAKGEKELSFLETFTGSKSKEKPEKGTTPTSVNSTTEDVVDSKTGEVIKSEEKPDAAKPAVYKETDKRSRIQQEVNEIKEAIGDDVGGGELALILSRAIGTPGTIADKVRAATELAIPILRERRKSTRDITLKAYDALKEKERAEIAAGKKGETGQLIEQYVAGKIKAGDKRDPAIITNEFIEERYLGAGKEDAALQKVIFNEDYKLTIKPALDKLNNLERQKQLTGKLSKDQEKSLEEVKFTIKQYNKKYPQFKQFITPNTFATGGRVNLAEGTQPESMIEQTVMKEGPSDVSIKPVNKLSYAELRDRLPKEITDDIVGLISNSEEALQEFAYIRTQKDINDFNVKYGVNLILPSTR